MTRRNLPDPDKILRDVNGITKKRKDWVCGRYMHGADINSFTEAMRKEFTYLDENAQSIFIKVINNDIQMEILKEMLDSLKKLRNGANKDAVEKELGKKLGDRYVQPLVDKLEEEKRKGKK